MLECHRDVMEFSRKLGAHVGDRPALPPADVLQLRLNLIEEEHRETVEAIRRGDLPAIVDGCLDSIYVLLGTLIAAGVDPVPLWQAVQRANISKAGRKRADGKILKDPDFKHPDIEGLLRAQGWEGGSR